MSETIPIRICISSCLLGSEVRYDGGHKRSRFVTDELSPFVEWVKLCPEVEAGLGVPRPAMRLVEVNQEPRLLEIKEKTDHTEALRSATRSRIQGLETVELSGAILKKDSPSCGMTRVKVYRETGMPQRDGVGLFAQALMQRFPSLPVEDEGRLNDARLRENFIERIFVYQRLRQMFLGEWKPGNVVAFHTAHKLQLMAHSTTLYNELGRSVAEIKKQSRADFEAEYQAGFMEAMKTLATPGRNANVLNHAAGHLKHLPAASRQELAALIDDYREGLVPLVAPIMLLRHHARTGAVEYLNGQTYLEPHPKELMLRNHV
ncbi:DUF523 and DUF1722 domain-containing protein [Myxococcota bacterium]|nr:DUF523 and DUF1722 domain-containing protein [Myxococcota bacterium]